MSLFYQKNGLLVQVLVYRVYPPPLERGGGAEPEEEPPLPCNDLEVWEGLTLPELPSLNSVTFPKGVPEWYLVLLCLNL
jgi:hypothetical protein